MNLFKKYVWSGIVLAMALGSTASRAEAHNISFELPFAARWGGVVLPPGSYRISVPMRMSGPPTIEVSSRSQRVSILVGVEESRPLSNHSYLSLVNIDGTYVVREFHSGASGKVFSFLLPKPIENRAVGVPKAQTTR